MRQENVDGRLKELVALFNTNVLRDGMQLQYTRTMMPVNGKMLCRLVHSELHRHHYRLHQLLVCRVRWANGSHVEEGDEACFVDFLQGTFVCRVWGALQYLADYMLLMQTTSRRRKPLVRGVVLLTLARSMCLAALTSTIITADLMHASCPQRSNTFDFPCSHLCRAATRCIMALGKLWTLRCAAAPDTAGTRW